MALLCRWLGLLVCLVYCCSLVNASEALTSGVTDDGIPYLGSFDAPVVLVEYSDYLCPYCARYHSSIKPELVEKYVAKGKMRMEFRHFPLASLHPTARAGHEAAACAAEQSSDLFWAFHNALFARQGEWNRLPEPADFLVELAESLNLDHTQWKNCVDIGQTKSHVEGDIELGKSHEFSGTPTFQMIANTEPEEIHTIVGARPAAYFSEYIEALLAGEAPPKQPERPKPELPDWAKPESLEINPERQNFTVSGDATYGDANARLVIVEFTDYQCPACARHAMETQPAIDEKLIATGKVRWVFKQLPLPQHANAVVAAAAAVCAGDQDRFHGMHMALFESQDEWSQLQNPDSVMIRLAINLDLDAVKFTDCLGSREAVQRIVNSVYEATSVTRSTPVFVVLDGETGRPMRGVRTPDQFVEVIEKHLESVLENDAKGAAGKSDYKRLDIDG